MRNHGREHTKKDRGEFRNVVTLRAFLDVIEVVQSEADDLARVGDREREDDAGQGAVRAGRRFPGKFRKRRKIAVAPPQPGSEVIGQARIDGLQIDDGVTLNNAEPQPLVTKTNDLHEWYSLIASLDAPCEGD